MRRVLLTLLLSCLAVPALADPAGIRVSPTPEGVRVDYRLAGPASRLAFPSAVSPEARMTALDEGVTVAPDGLTSLQPRADFSLLFGPDRVRVDATYPVVSRLGEGWMIHLPSLLADVGDGLGPEDVVIEPGPGWAVVAGPVEPSADGFVYVGPDVSSPTEGTRTIIDPAVPVWLTDDARAALETSNAFFAEGLAIPAPGRPVLLMGALPPEDRSTYVGDVTANGVINLQFATRMLPAGRDSRFTDLVVPFVAHETFHVWQGNGFRDEEGINGRWLTEGSAEYFSLLAQAAQSPEAAGRSRQVLARRFGACLSAMDLKSEGLLHLDEAAAQATRYDCGTVSQWLADLQTRSSGGLFGIWRGLLTRPDGYGVSEFRALLAEHPSAGDAGQAALLDGSTEIRGAVVSALDAMGARLSPADPGRVAWAQAALWPLLNSSCSGQRGIRTDDGRFFLDTGDRCGSLSGDLQAVSIDGQRFDVSAEAAFHAVEAACASRGAVTVGLMDGETVREVEASCSRAASPPPPAYTIASIP
ncbi:hypothetical protein GGQ87_000674 [Brevundimonas alba]|uniref:Peptidase M61 catalytic domain-containing protein n=1 Tax=Brevundimonas alba TaxID=74314 RepID=A0A7X6BNF8_9CAUL|nr:hypothetical protein [Brevundimonas alba]NJC40416.1 hypothetical protein [Brevundimonas alba]